MTKRTIELIMRVAIEIVDWLKIILTEKQKGRNSNDDRKGNSEEK